MQIPMSFAINRFGACKVVVSSIVLISLFNTIFSLSRTIEMLIIIRLLTGIFAHSGYASASSRSIFVFITYFINCLVGFMFILGVTTFFLTLIFVTLMVTPLKAFEEDAFAPSYSTIATGGIMRGVVTQIIIGFLVQVTGTFLSAFIYFLILGSLTGFCILYVKEKKQA